MQNAASDIKRSPLLLIVNSRRLARGRREFDRLIKRLETVSTCETRLTEYSGHAIELAQSEASQFPIVAAVGGDGTVSDVANGLIASASDSTMLPVPLGTGNDFARAVGIRTIDDAVDIIPNGCVRAIDAIEISWEQDGRLETRHSILTAGVAFGAEVMRRTDDRIKRIFGSRAAYTVGLFLALARYSPRRMRIMNSDSRSWDSKMFFVSIGNVDRTAGGTMCLSPGARMDDGKFDVCIFDVASKLKVVTSFVRILTGTHIRLPEVSYFPSIGLRVETEPSSELLIDGEALGSTPATFRMRPKALRVMSRAGSCNGRNGEG